MSGSAPHFLLASGGNDNLVKLWDIFTASGTNWICLQLVVIYHKIPIISPGLVFVQKAFLLGLFSGELIFRGAYYWKEFCVSK